MFGVDEIQFQDTSGLPLAGILPDQFQGGVAMEVWGPVYFDKHADAMWIELRDDRSYLNIVRASKLDDRTILCRMEGVGTMTETEAFEISPQRTTVFRCPRRD